MLLYWCNADSSGLWDNEENWFEDAAATVPHLSGPVNGDSCTLATNPDPHMTGVGRPTVDWNQIDLGAGTCDIDNLVVGNYMGSGSILSGMFTGANLSLQWNSPIWGGIYTGANISSNGANIYSGIFLGASFRGWAGTIYGGTFVGSDFNNAWMSRMQIFGGVFSAAASTWYMTNPQPGFWLSAGSIDVDGYSVTACGETNPGFLDTIASGSGGSGTIPATVDVRYGTAVGSGTGTLMVPGPSDVRSGVAVDATVGMLSVPLASDVRYPIAVDGQSGSCHVPPPSAVALGTAVDSVANATALGFTSGTQPTGVANLSSGLLGTGNALNLVTGDDYLYTDGRALLFGIPPGSIDLSGAASFALEVCDTQGGAPSGHVALTIPGSLATGPFTIAGQTFAQALRFEPTSAETYQLFNWQPNAYAYRVRAIWTSPPKTITVVLPTPATATW